MCAMAAISGHYRFGLIASGRQTAEMVTAALGAVSAAILIPIGYAKIGPEGAAMALCVAELIVWVSSWWCSHQMLGLRGHGKLLIRPILAAAFTAGMLSLLPVSFWAAQALLVGVLITALAFALDVVVRDEFRSLLLVRRRRPEWLSKRLPEATQ
jgi:O-antigen/teichoic acid export membrane protein